LTIELTMFESYDDHNPITPTQIKQTLKDDLTQTTQKAVSLPAIQRYVARLNAGEKAPPIKIDGDVIVDGNHRYIAGKMQGTICQRCKQVKWLQVKFFKFNRSKKYKSILSIGEISSR